MIFVVIAATAAAVVVVGVLVVVIMSVANFALVFAHRFLAAFAQVGLYDLGSQSVLSQESYLLHVVEFGVLFSRRRMGMLRV